MGSLGQALAHSHLVGRRAHLQAAEWSDAIASGNGDFSMKILPDSDFLIDLARTEAG